MIEFYFIVIKFEFLRVGFNLDVIFFKNFVNDFLV